MEAMISEVQHKGADALTNEQLGRFLNLLDLAKIVGTAAAKTAFDRIQGGGKVPGRTLAKAKANRTWKDEAETAAKEQFGIHAFTVPALKSPAQIDDLPLGSSFTARWAAKPDAGLTLVRDSDARPEVSRDTKSLFTAVAKKGAVS